MNGADPRRSLPSVEALLAGPEFAALRVAHPHDRLVGVVREVVDAARMELTTSSVRDARDAQWFADESARRLQSSRHGGPRAVINATGVVLHTNLGRAPLAQAAVDATAELARGYIDLEYDLAAGERGSRYDHCTGLLRELTGADALVVNNNAAAVVLAVNTLAAGRDVVVSRGELVEIGGSFRIAEIVQRSGARLLEVGATNKTHAADYERVLTPRTGAILKVHRSNFSVSGFVQEVDAPALARLGKANGVPVIHDLGSGLLLDDMPFDAGPTAREAVRAGVDLVTMSGDKLLGGPQAGILLGSGELIARLRANPLCRALRPDRMTIAALHATLALYSEPVRAREQIPTLRMLHATADEIQARARAMADTLVSRGVRASIVAAHSAIGGGAAPDQGLPTWLVAIDSRVPAEEVARRLRTGQPAIVARITGDRVVVDLRTVAADETEPLLDALARAATPR